MKKETVFYGTVILITVNIVIKVLSLIYRGILIRFIGADGIGMMEMITPVFSFLLVLSSWGVPMAMSNTISTANNHTEMLRCFQSGLKFLCLNSVFVCLIFLLVFPFFKQYIFSDPGVIPGFMPLLPAIIVISCFSAFRGYFQGTQRSSILGYSQLTEQIIRIIVGILIVHYLILMHCSKYTVLIGISVATLIAEFCGGLVLFVLFKIENGKLLPGKKVSVDKKLIQIGTPVTMSRIVLTVSSAMQAVIIPHYLTMNGYTVTDSAAFYGYFMGVAVTILHLPGIITGALSTPLLPSISSAHGKRQFELRNTRIAKGMFFTAISAMPLLALTYYYCEPLCRILFHSPEAAPILKILCFGGYFLYLQQPLVNALQGMNRFKIIFIVYLFGYSSYLIALIILGQFNFFTEENIILAYIAADIIIFLCFYCYLAGKEKICFRFSHWFTIPALGVTGGLIILDFVQKEIQTALPEIIGIMLSGIIFILVYAIIIFLCGVPDKESLKGFRWPRKHR